MPIAVERDFGCVLFEWVEGETVNIPTASDMDAAGNFVLALKEL